jgi:hypothetical protein
MNDSVEERVGIRDSQWPSAVVGGTGVGTSTTWTDLE